MSTTRLSHRLGWTTALIAGLSLAGLGAAAPEGSSDASHLREYDAHTAASEKRDQNFNVPGVVEKVLVKEGDTVTAGQLIAQQNTAADEAKLKSLELLARSQLELKAEEAQLAKDIVDRDRKEALLKQHALDPAQVDEARLAVIVDQFKAEHAKEDMEKAKYEVEEQKARIEEKKMHARIDGVISQISTHEGELANSDTQHPTITIVKNDPLYVELNLPSEIVKQLKLGQSLNVHYVDETANVWRLASIRFIKPEADPEANFEHVQLEMPNPEHRSSGLQVTVRLPDNVNVAAEQPNGAAAQAGASH